MQTAKHDLPSYLEVREVFMVPLIWLCVWSSTGSAVWHHCVHWAQHPWGGAGRTSSSRFWSKSEHAQGAEPAWDTVSAAADQV